MEFDLMSLTIVAIVAFLIDALIGDPRTKFHPVVLIGNLISLLEKILRRELDSPTVKIFKGGILEVIRTGLIALERGENTINDYQQECEYYSKNLL